MSRSIFVRSAALGLVVPLLFASLAAANVEEEIGGTWEGTVRCVGNGLSSQLTTFKANIDVRIVADPTGRTAAEFRDLGGYDGTRDAPENVAIHANGLCGMGVPGHGAANGPDVRDGGSLILGTLGTEQVYDVDFPMWSVLFSHIHIDLTPSGVAVEQRMNGISYIHPSMGLIGKCKVRLHRTDASRPTLAAELLSACSVFPRD